MSNRHAVGRHSGVSLGFRTPFPILYSADVERAAHFYGEGFGFVQTFRWPAEGRPQYVYLRLGDGGLGIGGRATLHGLPVATGDQTRFELCIYTDDTDRAMERLRRLGAKELVPPTDKPWGERLAYVADPDGNPIQITAKLKR
jgi:lactoylglutathione lyase